MKFTSVFALVACAVAAQATTPATVIADIGIINTKVIALNNLLQAYPATGGSLAGALAIHNAAAALAVVPPASPVGPIYQTTVDVGALSPLPTAAEFTSILDAIDVAKPTIVAALARIIVIKPSLVALPVGGLPALVHIDLTNLNAVTNALEAALLVKSPTTALTARANAIKATLDPAFAAALVAYP